MDSQVSAGRSFTSHLVPRVKIPGTPGTQTPHISETKPPQLAETVGQVVGLMMASPEHASLNVGELKGLLFPPLLTKQCRMLRKNGVATAYASWAFVSEEVDARLSSGDMSLDGMEWRSGHQPWLVDFIAPHGNGKELMREIKATVFPGARVKALSRNLENGTCSVVEL